MIRLADHAVRLLTPPLDPLWNKICDIQPFPCSITFTYDAKISGVILSINLKIPKDKKTRKPEKKGKSSKQEREAVHDFADPSTTTILAYFLRVLRYHHLLSSHDAAQSGNPRQNGQFGYRKGVSFVPFFFSYLSCFLSLLLFSAFD